MQIGFFLTFDLLFSNWLVLPKGLLFVTPFEVHISLQFMLYNYNLDFKFFSSKLNTIL